MLTGDVFSKRISCQLLKQKSGSEVLAALQSTFLELGEPCKIQVDKGKEFYNAPVKMFLKKKGINMFSTENADIKCAIAENAIRTLKTRIWRLMRSRGSWKYYDQLQRLVKSQNMTISRSHGHRPIDVTHKNSLEIFNNLYAALLMEKKKTPKYNKGEHVRMALEHVTFQKEYQGGFKDEVFLITKVIRRRPRPVYELADLDKEPVHGQFYEEELQRIKWPPHKHHST